MDPALLLARAVLLATLLVFLGVAGHVTADGLLPGTTVLVLLAAFTLLPCAALLARPASALRLVLAMVVGQALVHLVLTVSAGHVGDPARPSVARDAPRLWLPKVDGRRVGSLQGAYESGSGHGALQPKLPVGHLVADLSAHTPMMAAHLAAAALLGLWLAVGERSLWTVVALLAALVVRTATLLAAPVATAPWRPATAAVRHDRRPALTTLLARSVTRRGPPALLPA